ncbi:hypothetical protein BKK51_01790 [Rodentibacter trehalosifermentans]|uniref:MobA/MobL protein domain-containing protein n=1 Tax=Rodentibacter trehalosifermentans TaxID=1908263 RepID=A0A1V3J2N5_9PAST|nr:MobA/MobL family protein [Rodentibacter trehalosifermentans]OOF46697.1 hypothetical protein BKK51_01790 [Rodentibacter trehalosifermentans]OOF48970.1 hypothetical protein BKK52_04580 [Rodentibacter trehalosifermentans]
MAIYHLNVRRVSKAKGQSALAKSNYINRDDKYSSRFDDLKFSQSGNMPMFAQNNPSLFWESADIYERSNARVCTEIEFALPRELNLEQQQILVNEFIKQTIDNDKHKLPYSFAIHNDPENNNPHCHLIFSERHQDGIDRTPEQFFKRANSKALELGGAMKSKHANAREFVQDVRTTWRKLANQHLEKHGIDSRIDERTLKAQGIERDPTTHIHWREFKNLEQIQRQSDEIGQKIAQNVQDLAQERRYIELREQGEGIFSAKFASALKEPSKNPLNHTQSDFSEKGKGMQREREKTPVNRKESVSQADFDMFIYKTIKNAERPKFEHERKIEEWEKSLKQLKSTYADYKGDLERLESEKWGMLGLYQSKEQKAEIERIKGVMSDLSERFDRTKDYIAKEQEKIEQINKQNKPLFERKAQIMRDNPNLIEKSMAQLHQEQFKRNTEKWEREQKNKQKDRSLSRDDGLSL